MRRVLIVIVFVVIAFVPLRSAAAAAAADVKCVATDVVTLDVKKGSDKVIVTPKCVSVRGGGTIRWIIRSDAGTATFDMLHFLDTTKQAAAAGKGGKGNPMPLGDRCSGSSGNCDVTFLVTKGLYRYDARVRHEGKVKKSDPEVEVSCTHPCTGMAPTGGGR